ncbi:hypothetical protein LEM8419_03060 [Neolewinella maritima]|uniref:Uncharacterized protein n=1 Tax=Neolewinella maritima TaxID=1383882 RepID=A0ABN8FCW9_9BACT|nr:hypothetical protein [Neolewinella maritima]CAH1002143.1 hypothetical protein LEM8419_03060 [Neolewinella maritima]
MPIFSDLKKIFFGAKSVAKHQAGKVEDELTTQGDELLEMGKRAAAVVADRAPDYIKKGKDALNDLGDAVFREPDPVTPPDTTEQAKDIIDEELGFGSLDLSPEREAPKSGSIDFEDGLEEGTPPTPKEPSALRQVADSSLDAAARAGLKAKEQAGKLGDKLLDRAAQAGVDLKDKTDAFVEHANRETEKMDLEDTIREAKAAAAQAEARARAFDNKEGERTTEDSTLSGTDSFFDRADRFAKGDYHNEGGKDMRVQDDPDFEPRKKSDLIAGFMDNDGDGDSLIDDAIIEEE